MLTWRRLRHDKVAMASLIVIGVIIVLAIAAPLFVAITHHPPNTAYPNTGETAAGNPVPPGTAGFWLGTDGTGRDLFIRILYGARISLFVGFVTTAVGTLAGVAVGLIAGYFGGITDLVLGRFTDAVLAFPYVVLALALAVVLGPSLPVIVGVISFFSWAAIARMVRDQTLSIKEKDYIKAARSLGAGPFRIMFIDILPNLLAPVLVLATVSIPTAVVFEATLSYLGLGIQPPTASWGDILADAQSFYQVAWWYVVFPAAALLITTLAFNLLADGIRDTMDPRTEPAPRRMRPQPEAADMALIGFLIRRILSGIVVVWLVSTATFFLFFARPVDTVARQLAGRAATPQVIDEVIRNLGLTQPIIVQYWHFIDGLLHGDLGFSYYSHEPVDTMLKQDLPPTVSLMVGGLVLWLVAGLSVGIIGATRARVLFDKLSSAAALIGLSMPVVVIGELLILGVFVPLTQHGFHWIQTGYSAPSQGLSTWAGHMILPWITVAAVPAAVYARLCRGVDIGPLLGGVIVVEAVFGLGGVGEVSVQAIDTGNLPVIIGFVIIAAIFVVVANIIVDLVYALLDRRVRLAPPPRRP